MYFSRSFIASALLGLSTATTHMGEGMAAASTAVVASESMAGATSAMAAGASSTAVMPAAAGMVNTHVVNVGGANGSLVFSPNNVQAQPGDLVQFQFHPKNHSVVQSTFDQPCVPIQNVMANKTDAFFSGFMPSNASVGATSQLLTYTIRVMDAKPVWFYCSQAKHCQSGMVGAINAPASGNKTMAAFIQLAAAATENLSPGQAPGSGAGSGAAASSGAAAAPSGGEAGATNTAGGAAASGTAGSSPAQASTNAAPGGLTDAARQSFLGLGLGGLVAFLLL